MAAAKQQRLAIFDIDGTVFRSSLLIQLVETFIERNVFPEKARREYAREYLAWLDRKGSYEEYIMAVVYAFRRHLKGVFYGDFADIAKEVVAIERDRTYRYTRDLIADLKKRGFFLLAISHSPKGILNHFCKRLGFNKVYGIMYELGPNDTFTGRLLDEHIIMNKANVLRRTVEKEHLTLKGSVGVGDTESDYPFLELVEKPICFNPNAALLRHARRNGWNVIVERKDAVYEIQ